MTTMIFVRHCEAEGNIKRIFHGRTNSQISENGKTQLELLAKRFENIDYDYIYSSPLNRTLLTAQAVNRHLQKPIEICEGIIEIDGGHWEQKQWKDFPSLFPQEAYDWAEAPHNFHPVDGESMTQVRERMVSSVLEIAKRHKGSRIVCVSHGCALRNLICWAYGWEIERLNDVDWGDNTAVSMIEFDDDFKPKVIFANDCSHLSDDVKTLAKQSWWKKDGASLQDKFST